MDGTAAIQSNLEALKRILAGLLAMAGLGADALTSPQDPGTGGGRRDASGGGSDAGETPTRRPDDRRPPLKGEVTPRPTLPRHLRLAILRLLRPAEAAARRLIIASARGLVVTLPPPRKRKPKPATAEPFLRRFGIAVVLPAGANPILPRSRGVSSRFAEGKSIVPVVRWKAGERRDAAQQRGPGRQGTAESGGGGGLGVPALPLFDPPRRFRPSARRAVPAHAAPRILFPGISQPHTLPPPPSPDDPVDATRLGLRLAALAAALGDLPGQARRFARWKARHQRAAESPSPLWGGVRGGGHLRRRTSPLRPGRPPGGRLARFDPSARRSHKIREVDEILAHAHALALYALAPPDTS
ncbi:MAG TPA: hypothetical protein VIZ90_15205 [Rhizobiaceae bacterium]